MSRKTAKSSPIKLRAGQTSPDLGWLTAETDQRLATYYVGRDRYVARALNGDDQASFFVGPKGVGKSAVLQMVRVEMQTDSQRVINLSPKQLALSAFTNIDIPSSFLIDANKKQWLYKSLWDYILTTEIGSREFPEDTSFSWFWNRFRGSDEKKVRRLLQLRFNDQGEVDTLSNRFFKLLKEIELSGSVGIGGKEVSGTTTLDVSQLGKHGQFELLGLLHHVSTRLPDTILKRYYVLIDDLDDDWQNEPVQNEIIAAMFASLRKICRTPLLKAVVAIQDRILRALPIEHKDKFRDSICSIEWDAVAVKEMLERRIKVVIDIAVSRIWTDLFPENAFDFIWEHISGKPREAIRLTSLCLEKARRNSHSAVTESDMQDVLKAFSTERLEDISNDLSYRFPEFIKFLFCFSGFPKEFPATKVKEAVDTCILRSLDEKSPGYLWIRGYEDNYFELLRVLLESQILLYKEGRKDIPVEFEKSRHDIYRDGVHVAFHPMYWAGLGVIGGV